MNVQQLSGMSPADYKEVRGFVRWAKIGATPAIGRADGVLEVLGLYRDKALDAVVSIAQEIRRGVMVSVDACKIAEEQLEREGLPSENVDSEVERVRG